MKYQHLIVRLHTVFVADFQLEMDRRGNDGWEVCAIDFTAGIIVFKRLT